MNWRLFCSERKGRIREGEARKETGVGRESVLWDASHV